MKRPVERISTGQLFMLAGGVGMGTVFLPISSVMARVAGSDSVLSLLASALIAVPAAYYVTHPSILAFPRKALGAQFRLAFGGILGPVLAAVIGIACLGFATCLARQIGDVYILSLLPRTPPIVFSLPILFLAAVMCLEGVEVLTRYSGIVFPILLLTLVALIVGTAGDVKTGNYLPFLEYGLGPPLRGLVRALSYAGEVVVFVWTVVPTINQPRGANVAIVKGASLAAFVMIGINIVSIGVFSAPEVARLFYATIDLAKMIQSGGYLRGVESIVIGIFTAASLLKVTAFLLAASRILGEVFGMRNYRPLVIPLSIAAAIGVVLLRDATRMTRVIDSIDFYVMLPCFLVVPLIVRLLGVWRYQRRRSKASSA